MKQSQIMKQAIENARLETAREIFKEFEEIEKMLFMSGWEELSARVWENKTFQEMYNIGAKEMEDVWHGKLKRFISDFKKEFPTEEKEK